jgi:hypothetical protein
MSSLVAYCDFLVGRMREISAAETQEDRDRIMLAVDADWLAALNFAHAADAKIRHASTEFLRALGDECLALGIDGGHAFAHDLVGGLPEWFYDAIASHGRVVDAPAEPPATDPPSEPASQPVDETTPGPVGEAADDVTHEPAPVDAPAEPEAAPHDPQPSPT